MACMLMDFIFSSFGNWKVFPHAYFLLSVVCIFQAYVHNHLKLVLRYHTEDATLYRVVGFEIEARRLVPVGKYIQEWIFLHFHESESSNLQKITEYLFSFFLLIQYRC